MRFVYLVTPMQLLAGLVLGAIFAIKLASLALTYGFILLIAAIVWFLLIAATHAALNVWAEKVGGVSVVPIHVENFRPFYSIGEIITRLRHLMSLSDPQMAARADSPAIRKSGVFLASFVVALAAIYAGEAAIGLVGHNTAWHPTFALVAAAVIAWAIKNKFEAFWNDPYNRDAP
jgi:hypothetical protein